MESVTMMDGKQLSVGHRVRLNCSCHTDKQGEVVRIPWSDLVEIKLGDGDLVTLPSVLVTKL